MMWYLVVNITNSEKLLMKYHHMGVEQKTNYVELGEHMSICMSATIMVVDSQTTYLKANGNCLFTTIEI